MSFHDLHDLNINKNEFNIDIWMEKIGKKKYLCIRLEYRTRRIEKTFD